MDPLLSPASAPPSLFKGESLTSFDDAALPTHSVNSAVNDSFRKLIETQKPKEKTPLFDGGGMAHMRAMHAQEDMQSLNKGAMSSIVGLDIDKEFDFLTQLLIEEYKDPDPSSEKDHSETTRTIVTMVSAANQAKMVETMDENNKLIQKQTRLHHETRIGKKVQYEDCFFEVRDQDTSVPIYYRLGEDAIEGEIRIMDAAGNIVNVVPLVHNDERNDKKKGDHKIEWDLSVMGAGEGVKAPAGVYFVEFKAINERDEMIPHIMEMEGVISKVDANEDGSVDYFVNDVKIDGRITKVAKAPKLIQGAVSESSASALPPPLPIASYVRQQNGHMSGAPVTPERGLEGALGETNVMA